MKTWLIVVSVIAVLLAVSTGVGLWMLSDTRAELSSTRADLAFSEAELANTEAELESTEAELTSTEEELTKIKEVYPLRDFESYSELEAFVRYNIQPDTDTADKWYRAARKVQELAMEQGYLVSAAISDVGDGYYLVFNLAVADDILWWWYPEDGELIEYPISIYD